MSQIANKNKQFHKQKKNGKTTTKCYLNLQTSFFINSIYIIA